MTVCAGSFPKPADALSRDGGLLTDGSGQQSTWTAREISVDANDRYTVRETDHMPLSMGQDNPLTTERSSYHLTD